MWILDSLCLILHDKTDKKNFMGKDTTSFSLMQQLFLIIKRNLYFVENMNIYRFQGK